MTRIPDAEGRRPLVARTPGAGGPLSASEIAWRIIVVGLIVMLPLTVT